MAVLDELTPADDEMTNILLAHAGNHGAIPIDYPTIRKAGFDYIGLGHEASYKICTMAGFVIRVYWNRTITGRPDRMAMCRESYQMAWYRYGLCLHHKRI